jgi:hypothetical protein
MAVDHCLDVLDWTERQGATRMKKLRETALEGLEGILGHFPGSGCLSRDV